MKILRTVEAMRAACQAARSQSRGGRLGLVPTMGALHQGHLSLVRMARAQCGLTAVSVFVNPAQFAPGEDFERYPRDFERDRTLLEREGVNLLFAPEAAEMYMHAAKAWVDVEGLSGRLCGRSRPGHFRGVATVVAKLFHIVEPDLAFFGQKDAAQVAVIRRMVRDLNFAVEIVVCPIVREPDGLALSSRNGYLTAEERRRAPVLYRALRRVQALAESGERDPQVLTAAGRAVIAEEPAVRLDYLELVDAESLEPVTGLEQGALVAVAALLGRTRLIDNLLLAPPPNSGS